MSIDCTTQPELCVAKTVTRNLKILLIIGIVASAGLASFITSVVVNNAHEGTTGPISPLIDGLITYDEWATADYNFYNPISSYLDVDNEIDVNDQANIDTYNHVYVGENASHLLLAADLCGDRTNVKTDEWISVWLNTQNRAFGGTSGYDWFDWRNNGTEYLYYDVDNDVKNPIPFVYPYPTLEKSEMVTDNYADETDPYKDTTVTLLQGTPGTGEWNYTRNDDLFGYTVNSAGNWIEFRVVVDMPTLFDVPADLWTEWFTACANLNLEMVFRIRNLDTGSSYNMPNADFLTRQINFPTDDSARTLNLGTSTTATEVAVVLAGVTPDAVTTNGQFTLVFRFQTLNAIDNWWLNLDYFEISLDTPVSNHIEWVWGSETIQNFDIAYGFGPSPRCAADHRMFEIAIPKTELNGYNSTNLSLYIQGYGTLSFEDTNYYAIGAATMGNGPWTLGRPDWSMNYISLALGTANAVPLW